MAFLWVIYGEKRLLRKHIQKSSLMLLWWFECEKVDLTAEIKISENVLSLFGALYSDNSKQTSQAVLWLHNLAFLSSLYWSIPHSEDRDQSITKATSSQCPNHIITNIFKRKQKQIHPVSKAWKPKKKRLQALPRLLVWSTIQSSPNNGFNKIHSSIKDTLDFSLYLPHIQQVTLTLSMIIAVACQPVLPTQFITMLTLLLTQIALNLLHWIPMPLTLHSRTTRPSLLPRSYQITMKWNSLVNYEQKLSYTKGKHRPLPSTLCTQYDKVSCSIKNKLVNVYKGNVHVLAKWECEFRSRHGGSLTITKQDYPLGLHTALHMKNIAQQVLLLEWKLEI